MSDWSKLGRTAALTAFAALLVGVAPAEAQQPTPEADAAEVEVSDQELMTFTRAHLEVEDIQEDLQERLQQVQEAQEAQAIQQDANDQMVLTIREHGFDVDRYGQIVNAINADPELQTKFEMMRASLEEEEGEPDGR